MSALEQARALLADLEEGKMKLNDRELATILSALRIAQHSREGWRPMDEPFDNLPYFTDVTPMTNAEIDALVEWLNDSEHPPAPPYQRKTLPCSVCRRQCNAGRAHRHQKDYIGDECCWDERLKASE